MGTNNFKGFVKLVTETLELTKVSYVIVGGLVTIIYGRPRTTMDIDIIISQSDNFNILEKTFKANGFDITENEIKIALEESSHCSIFHDKYPYRIDLQGIYSRLDKIAFDNKEKRKALGISLMIEKIEDAIIGKLVYGSQQDLEDAKSIFENQKEKIDLNYLNNYAKELGVSDKLKKLIKI